MEHASDTQAQQGPHRAAASKAEPSAPTAQRSRLASVDLVQPQTTNPPQSIFNKPTPPAPATPHHSTQSLQHSPALLTQRQRLIATFGPVMQRAVIPHGPIAGLAADLDTADRDASKRQIDTMWNGGKVGGLVALRLHLEAADPELHPRNNAALVSHIKGLLDKQASADPNAGNSGWLAQKNFDYWNPTGDQTGITPQPGRGEVLPDEPTDLQANALAVRSWQIGDIVDGVSWSTLGRHLQGRLSAADYVDLGDGILRRRDLSNGTDLQAAADDAQKTAVARASLLRVANEVRGGLDGLPVKEGVSYRAATSAPGVFGSAINVGDYIKDMAFWSTSGLKLAHRGDDFGSEGTLGEPKVYYIITGSTGVFLPRFTNKEVGVREVLFKDQTLFQVNRITNYANRTIFVHVTEIDPATLAAPPATKDPWSGRNNP